VIGTLDIIGGFKACTFKPDYRGKGYMDLLLDAIRSEMKEQNGLELRLYVHENNQAAIRAYEKANFTFSKYRIMIQK
jgi:ribosomal protein S18 acetylase RimI-like enzyme